MLEGFPSKTLKKLTFKIYVLYKVVRKINYNICEIDLLMDIEISLVFNVLDLILYYRQASNTIISYISTINIQVNTFLLIFVPFYH